MRISRCGQIVLEYLLVGAVVAAVTLLAFSNFDDAVRASFVRVFHGAVDQIAQ